MATRDDMLAKIQALMAKAESTEFQAERDAFMDAAQRLVIKFAVEEWEIGGSKQALLTSTVLNAPYPNANARTRLLSVVARLNNGKIVLLPSKTARGGKVIPCTVIAYTDDLEMIKIMYATVSIQCLQAMKTAQEEQYIIYSAEGVGFNESFIAGYAQGFYEKLNKINQQAKDETPGYGLMVRSRVDQVGDLLNQMYPNTYTTRRRVGSAVGYSAGKVAGLNNNSGSKGVGGRQRSIGAGS